MDPKDLTTAISLTATSVPAAVTLLSWPLVEKVGQTSASEHLLCILSLPPPTTLHDLNKNVNFYIETQVTNRRFIVAAVVLNLKVFRRLLM